MAYISEKQKEMKRKEFLKKALAGSAASLVGVTALANSKTKESEKIGYNHLPNKENKTMNTVLHKALNIPNSKSISGV